MGYQLDFGALSGYFGLFLQGLWVTLGLTAISATLGIALSIGGAATERSGPKWARASVLAYVELIRNTPFIVQMFFIFFGLPSLGLKLTALQAAALAMTINLTAYAIEIVRAGIEAVPPGQREAGAALGIRPATVFLQEAASALAIAQPALVSQIVMTMLNLPVSPIPLTDLTQVADLIQSRTYRAFETYFVITLVYLALAAGLRRLFALAGRRLIAGRLK
jgi:polar amino acid transport system permease protein